MNTYINSDNGKKIYDYLNLKKEFTKNEYNYLINMYDKDEVHGVIIFILECGRGINSSLYNKIINYGISDNKRYELINDVYMKYLYQVIGRINQLFSEMGFVDKSFNGKFMAERVKIVNDQSTQVENVAIINELYEEFLILRNMVAEANQFFVGTMVNRYRSDYVDIEELYQEGYIGLLRAIELYNPFSNFTFSTYATGWVSGYIRRKINKSILPLYVPFNSIIDYCKYKRVVDNLYMKLQRKPTYEEISSELNLPIDMVQEFDKLSETTASIYETVVGDDNVELIEALSSDDSERMIEDNMMTNDLKDIFDEVLVELNEKQRKVIYYRFLNCKKMPFREIGEILGFSKQGAQDSFSRALVKIRKNEDKFVQFLQR